MKASENSVKAARLFGLLGMISLLSYAAAVIFAPLAYSGYDSLSQAVSDLSADTAPSRVLWNQLSALYMPCGIVCCTFCRYELGFRGRLRNVSAPEFGKTRGISGHYAPCNNRGGRCFERRFSCFDYLRRIPKKGVAVSCRICGGRAYGNVCRCCGNGCFACGIFRHSRTFQRFFRNGVQCRSRRLSVFRKTRKSGA